MTQLAKLKDPDLQSADAAAGRSSLAVRRVDLRSPLTVTGGQLARVEFVHHERGKFSEIGRGHGGFDAMLQAANFATGVDGVLTELSVHFGIPEQGPPQCEVTVSVVRDGEPVTVSRTGAHLLTTCLEAYLDALATECQAIDMPTILSTSR